MSQTWDGIYLLNGMFDAESGEVLKAALNALLPPLADEDHRSAGQRRADALLEICRQSLDSGSLPQRGGQKPHLHLLAELDALQKLKSAAAPELNRRQMVPAETARRIACDAGLSTETSRQNGEGGGDVLSLMSRVVSGATRRALWQRDGGCRFPVVTVRLNGRTPITSSTGRTAAKRSSAISSCSAAAITGRFTSKAGAS